MKAIYQSFPEVHFATNIFVNVPVIVKYDDHNIVEMAHLFNLGYTLEIPIYHSDGTYLAKVRRHRVYPTEDGKKAGIELIKNEGQVVCELNGKTIFELNQLKGDSFKLSAELFVPDGNMLKVYDDFKLGDFSAGDDGIKINGLTLSDSRLEGVSIGIHAKSNGGFEIGVR